MRLHRLLRLAPALAPRAREPQHSEDPEAEAIYTVAPLDPDSAALMDAGGGAPAQPRR